MLFNVDKEHEVKNSQENTRYKVNHQIPKTGSNFPTKTKTLNQLSLSASLLHHNKQDMHKSSTIATEVPEDMAAHTPVEIGTRGTIGSLIMQEIKYFSQLELSSRESSQKPHSHTGMASTSSQSKATFGSVITAPKKKKKGGNRLLPSICSMVEVSNNNQPIGISAFSYRSLKSDVRKLQA